MTKPLSLAAAAISLLGLTNTQAANSGLGGVKAGAYKVESYHTQVGFSVSHFGLSNYSGMFSGVTGSLHLDAANLGASRFDITIPVESVTTTVSKLTDELKGDQWFDSAKFPNATFVSTKVEPASGGATVTGNLTLHGITKPVVLHVHFVGAGVNPIDKAYTVGFDVTGTIKRSEFGIKTYLPGVGDDVQLTIAGAFERQS